MSKRREALRRGLRSFIEDTSRELADLEGRPLRPPPGSEADGETVVVSEAIVDVAERAATDSAPPDVEADSTHSPDLEAASPRHEVPTGAGSAPEPPAAPARTVPMRDTAPIAPARAGRAPAPAVLETQEPSTAPPSMPQPSKDVPPPVARRGVEPTAPPTAPLGARHSTGPEHEPDSHLMEPEPAAHRYGQTAAAPARAEKPKRRAKAPVPRRPRQAAEIVANGVSPAQAHARKGVCFAYFLNHECWRVADAYCNSALQVCITRECPIYHLHKDALERRFARKFKHFW